MCVCLCVFISVPTVHSVSRLVSQRSEPPCWVRASFPWAILISFIESIMSEDRRLLFFRYHLSLFKNSNFQVSSSLKAHLHTLPLWGQCSTSLVKGQLIICDIWSLRNVVFNIWRVCLKCWDLQTKSFCHFNFFLRLLSNFRNKSLCVLSSNLRGHCTFPPFFLCPILVFLSHNVNILHLLLLT